MPKVMVELPQEVFDRLMKMQGSIKEIVEDIVVKAVLEPKNKKNREILKKLKEKEKQIKALNEVLKKERLKRAELGVEREELLKQLHNLEKENKELQELLSEAIKRLERLKKINEEIVVSVRQGVKEAFRELLREYETAGFKLQKSFLEKCRQVVVAVNKYLDSAEENYRVRIYPQDDNDVLVATIVNTENPFHTPPERVYKTVASMIRGLDVEKEISVEITDDGKYLLLKRR